MMKTRFIRTMEKWNTSRTVAFLMLGFAVPYSGSGAEKISDLFDIPDIEWTEASRAPFGSHYKILRGRLKVENGTLITADKDIGSRNELLASDLEIPDESTASYSLSLDFKMPEITKNSTLSVLLNHKSTSDYGCFRLRFGQDGKTAAQLILMKKGASQKGSGEMIHAEFTPNEWYRLKINCAHPGEYAYELSAVKDASPIGVGILLDPTTDQNYLTGGVIGFGASGDSFTLDNFQLEVNP